MEKNNQYKEVIAILNDLLQIDIDAYHAYNQSIDSMEESTYREKLTDFRSDHERHIGALSDLIHQLGGQPTDFSRDFKGFLISGYTAIRSITGTVGILKAMDTNEILTKDRYQQALKAPLPDSVKEVVTSHMHDEERHVSEIEKMLNEATK